MANPSSHAGGDLLVAPSESGGVSGRPGTSPAKKAALRATTVSRRLGGRGAQVVPRLRSQAARRRHSMPCGSCDAVHCSSQIFPRRPGRAARYTPFATAAHHGGRRASRGARARRRRSLHRAVPPGELSFSVSGSISGLPNRAPTTSRSSRSPVSSRPPCPVPKRVGRCDRPASERTHRLAKFIEVGHITMGILILAAGHWVHHPDPCHLGVKRASAAAVGELESVSAPDRNGPDRPVRDADNLSARPGNEARPASRIRVPCRGIILASVPDGTTSGRGGRTAGGGWGRRRADSARGRGRAGPA